MPGPDRDPPPAERGSERPFVPAVVGLDREERERRQRNRALLRSPAYLVIAVLVHLAAIAWLWSFGSMLAEEEPVRILRASVAEQVTPEHEPPPELEPPELQPPEPELPDPSLLEDPLVEDDRPFDDRFSPNDADLLGVGGGGGGRGGRRSALSMGPSELDIGSGSTPFRAYVDDLRARGLDVAFVIDATASMERVIARARATVDDIIADLSSVVPDLRLGLVAYRDHGDDWLTRQVDLTDDRYRIHNFLADLEAGGGGDFEEAVDEALRAATGTLSWRDHARHVVILVGDAPPHPADEGDTLATVRSFARDGHSAVSVLFTTARTEGKPTDRETAARTVMEKIARTGNGVLATLDEEANLRDRILDASFGTEWREEIRALVARRLDDRRQRIVEDKVRAGDVTWLLRRLTDQPVHPAIVDGCIALSDRRVAERALQLLTDPRQPRTVGSVALYILKRTVAPGVPYDPDAPGAERDRQIGKIRREIDKLPPVKGSTPPPAPRPPSGAPPPPPPAPRSP